MLTLCVVSLSSNDYTFDLPSFFRSFSNSFSCSPSLLLQSLTLFQLLTILILTLSYLYFFQSLSCLSIMLSVFHLFTTLNNSTLLFTSSLYRDHTLAISQLLSHSLTLLISHFLLYYSDTLALSVSLTHAHLSLASQFFTLATRSYPQSLVIVS